MRRRSSKLHGRFIGLLFLLLIFVACNMPVIQAIPAQSVPPPSAHTILVVITEPNDGESYPFTTELPIRAEALSDEAIDRMELWVDGELFQDLTAPLDETKSLAHTWVWSPGEPGLHSLMVVAVDSQGQKGFSNVIYITGIEDPGLFPTSGTLPDRLPQGGQLPSGFSLVKSVNSYSDNAGYAAPITGKAPANSAAGVSTTPTAPGLTVVGAGCDAILTISDRSLNEEGFEVYRLSPGASTFTRLALLQAHQGLGDFTYSDVGLFGKYQYYVSAYDRSGGQTGNLASVNITDQSCAGTPVSLDGLVSIPQGVDDIYLYLTVDNSAWMRFPAGNFSYLDGSREIDLLRIASGFSQKKSDMPVRGEVWGIVEGAAVKLGTFNRTISLEKPPPVFDPASLHLAQITSLEVQGTFDVSSQKYLWVKEKGIKYGVETFRFATSTSAASGIWQVSSVPFQGEPSLNPACLLLTGETKGSGTDASPHQFTIDFSPLKPTIQSAVLSPFENILADKPIIQAPYSPGEMKTGGQQVVNATQWNPNGFDLGGKPPIVAVAFDPCAQNVTPEGIATYYVRILPVNNGQPAGSPSNTVVLKHDPNSEIKVKIPVVPIPNQPYYDVKILNFTGVKVPDTKYTYCVEVVENPYYGISLGPWGNWAPGHVECPKVYSGGTEKNYLGPIADALNFISKYYNKLSDWATELVDQLNPLCIQAKLASKAVNAGEQEVKDACHLVAKLVVAAAKTYVGLPPSLPNYDQLTEMGKENLVELAAQELENQGVPCPEDCKDIIRSGIDKSLEQVKKNMSNSSCLGEAEAHAKGFEPLCLPAGIVTQPDPRGQPAPALAEVKVTRRPGTTGPSFPPPVTCNVSIQVEAQNSVAGSYVSEAGFNWNGGSISGTILDGSGAFPSLQPGESISFPIILKPYPFWLPGHKEFVKKGWKPEHFDDWYILYSGALATVNAAGSCKFEFPEGVGFSDVAVNGDSMKTGPLGSAWKQTCHPYNCP